MKKFLSPIVFVLFGIYICKLFITNQLQLYINANNIWYTAVSGLLCVLIGIGSFIFALREYKKRNLHFSLSQILFFLPLILALLFGLLLPPRTILFTQANFFPITPPVYANSPVKDEVIARLLGFDTEQYTFAEWYLVQSLSPSFAYQNGKSVDLTGQVFTIDQTHHTFFFGRLYITCCVVDARPFGYTTRYLALKNAPVPFQPNEWVRIHGSFIVDASTGKPKLILFPLQTQIVSQPRNPYINK